MIIVMDIPEAAKKIKNLFFMINWASRDIIVNIMNSIVTIAKCTFQKLPKQSINPEVVQSVREAIEYTTCHGLEFKLQEHTFDAMVAELYDFLEQNRDEIWNKLLQLKETLKPFGKMLIDTSCFIKTKSSLINKINRELPIKKQLDKESILKSFLLNDFIRFRVFVNENHYEDLVNEMIDN
jgi:hypothetical protein